MSQFEIRRCLEEAWGWRQTVDGGRVVPDNPHARKIAETLKAAGLATARPSAEGFWRIFFTRKGRDIGENILWAGNEGEV